MEIREILPWDKIHFIHLVNEFYSLPAVAHPIPEGNAEKTFDLLMGDTGYARCFVAVNENDVPEGYCLCSITWSNEAGGLCVWIEELMMRDSLRGLGIGKKLIDTVFAAYPAAARFRLEVTEENTRARALYERLGFEGIPYQQMFIDLPKK